MPAISGSAPGKIILFGEHAVVYGKPAIAVPVSEVKARAMITPDILGSPGGIQITAPDIQIDSPLAELPLNDAIAKAVSGTLELLDITAPPAFKLRVTSTIPLAAGLGSGAAVSVAVSRAVAGFLGVSLSSAQISEIAFEVEKIHHGTPSGIDNTVIAHEQPVYFVKGQAIESFDVHNPFTIVIADTGVKSSTAVSVGDVRAAWEANQDKYERIFNEIGDISRQARQHIESGVPEKMGELMDANHELLSQMGVSSPELDSLTKAARTAGALGAKLSGGGRGGNMIALVTKNMAALVEQALLTAGAINTIITTVANQGVR
ncbi:MAG: mevalonate kinase [Chloroflexota bacterium]